MPNETIQGVITRVNKWKSNKGSFLKIDSIETDFFKFGGLDAEVGDSCEITYKQGKGNYSDKFEVVRVEILNKGTMPGKPTTGGTDFKPTEVNKITNYTSNNVSDSIMRSVALKCASWIDAARVATGADPETTAVLDRTVQLAKGFEPYLKGEK